MNSEDIKKTPEWSEIVCEQRFWVWMKEEHNPEEEKNVEKVRSVIGDDAWTEIDDGRSMTLYEMCQVAADLGFYTRIDFVERDEKCFEWYGDPANRDFGDWVMIKNGRVEARLVYYHDGGDPEYEGYVAEHWDGSRIYRTVDHFRGKSLQEIREATERQTL